MAGVVGKAFGVAILSVAGGIAISTVGWPSWWIDEIYTRKCVAMPVPELVAQRAAAGHPPIFFLIEKAISVALGSEEAALRLVPLLFGIATLPICYWLCYMLKGQSFGLWATSLVSFLPTHLWVSQIARSYSMCCALQLAILAILVNRSRKENVSSEGAKSRLDGSCVLVMLLSTLAMGTHTSACLSIAAMVGAIAICTQNRRGPILAICIGAILPVVFLLCFPTMGHISHHVRWAPKLEVAHVIAFPVTMQKGPFWPKVPFWAEAICSVVLVYVVLSAMQKRDLWSLLAWQVWLTWVLAIALAAAGANTIVSQRYFAFSSLLCWLLVIRLLSYREPGRWPNRLGSLCLFFVVVLGTYHYFRWPIVPMFREMTEIVANNRAADELVAFVNTSNQVLQFQEYYTGKCIIAPNPNDERMADGEISGVWVCGPWQMGKLEPWAKSLEARFDGREDFALRNGAVIHLYEIGTSAK